MHFESISVKKMKKKYVPTLPKIFRPVTQNTLIIFLFGLRCLMLELKIGRLHCFVSTIMMNVWENLNPHMYIDSRIFLN